MHVALNPYYVVCFYILKIFLKKVKNFLFKINFFYVFKLFWCADFKNNFFKKNYFDTFYKWKTLYKATATTLSGISGLTLKKLYFRFWFLSILKLNYKNYYFNKTQLIQLFFNNLIDSIEMGLS
jgi:hypothetical protein